MGKVSAAGRPYLRDSLPFEAEHYKEYKRRQVLRLLFSYVAPLLILVFYFALEYSSLISESRRLHLTAIAENQANTLNLFLTERVVNLRNLVNDPRFLADHSPEAMEGFLSDLVKSSETFVDVGFFSAQGIQSSYAGPHRSLQNRDYGSESWFQKLGRTDQDFIITDIYLGFRQRPHFTIAVKGQSGTQPPILRATLDPERIYDYIRTLEGANEVSISIVNKEGYYQLVTPHMGTLLESSAIVPPAEPRLGAQAVRIGDTQAFYAYSWLKLADWALIVQPHSPDAAGFLAGPIRALLLVSVPLLVLIVFVIFARANKLVALQKSSDRAQAQLAQASKLASVGELAAGIAHEINNPLAVINEEAGLVKDLMDPQFGEPTPREELLPHLDNIEESVLRCRKITHKLLGFVRKSNVELLLHDLTAVTDEVLDGLMGPELAVSNIQIVRDYAGDLPLVRTDSNQLQQVILNLLNNAVDALEGRAGTITIGVRKVQTDVQIRVSDTGKGMSPEQLGKIFMPFYTTKEVGKGTGLGLSVSYGIIKDLGGSIEVESALGEGSTFTILLPIERS